jgi:hypothetical protein
VDKWVATCDPFNCFTLLDKHMMSAVVSRFDHDSEDRALKGAQWFMESNATLAALMK